MEFKQNDVSTSHTRNTIPVESNLARERSSLSNASQYGQSLGNQGNKHSSVTGLHPAKDPDGKGTVSAHAAPSITESIAATEISAIETDQSTHGSSLKHAISVASQQQTFYAPPKGSPVRSGASPRPVSVYNPPNPDLERPMSFVYAPRDFSGKAQEQINVARPSQEPALSTIEHSPSISSISTPNSPSKSQSFRKSFQNGQPTQPGQQLSPSSEQMPPQTPITTPSPTHPTLSPTKTSPQPPKTTPRKGNRWTALLGPKKAQGPITQSKALQDIPSAKSTTAVAAPVNSGPISPPISPGLPSPMNASVVSQPSPQLSSPPHIATSPSPIPSEHSESQFVPNDVAMAARSPSTKHLYMQNPNASIASPGSDSVAHPGLKKQRFSFSQIQHAEPPKKKNRFSIFGNIFRISGRKQVTNQSSKLKKDDQSFSHIQQRPFELTMPTSNDPDVEDVRAPPNRPATVATSPSPTLSTAHPVLSNKHPQAQLSLFPQASLSNSSSQKSHHLHGPTSQRSHPSIPQPLPSPISPQHQQASQQHHKHPQIPSSPQSMLQPPSNLSPLRSSQQGQLLMHPSNQQAMVYLYPNAPGQTPKGIIYTPSHGKSPPLQSQINLHHQQQQQQQKYQQQQYQQQEHQHQHQQNLAYSQQYQQLTKLHYPVGQPSRINPATPQSQQFRHGGIQLVSNMHHAHQHQPNPAQHTTTGPRISSMAALNQPQVPPQTTPQILQGNLQASVPSHLTGNSQTPASMNPAKQDLSPPAGLGNTIPLNAHQNSEKSLLHGKAAARQSMQSINIPALPPQLPVIDNFNEKPLIRMSQVFPPRNSFQQAYSDQHQPSLTESRFEAQNAPSTILSQHGTPASANRQSAQYLQQKNEEASAVAPAARVSRTFTSDLASVPLRPLTQQATAVAPMVEIPHSPPEEAQIPPLPQEEIPILQPKPKHVLGSVSYKPDSIKALPVQPSKPPQQTGSRYPYPTTTVYQSQQVVNNNPSVKAYIAPPQHSAQNLGRSATLAEQSSRAAVQRKGFAPGTVTRPTAKSMSTINETSTFISSNINATTAEPALVPAAQSNRTAASNIDDSFAPHSAHNLSNRKRTSSSMKSVHVAGSREPIELPAVPADDKKEEAPVMKATSYPGDEWMPDWDDDG